MSMNATDASSSASAMRRATVRLSGAGPAGNADDERVSPVREKRGGGHDHVSKVLKVLEGSRCSRRDPVEHPSSSTLITMSTLSTFIHANPPRCSSRRAPRRRRRPPEPVELIVAATTDVPGWLGGGTTTSTPPTRARARSRGDHRGFAARGGPGRVVLVDAGDILQGNPLA